MSVPTDLITRPSLTDTVADRILGLIRSTQFVVGDRLPPSAKLVQMFGVAPETLLDALEKLRLVGVLDVRHRDEVYVIGSQSPLIVPNVALGETATKTLLLDLVEARETIEVPAIKAAAAHADERDLDRMRACLSAEAASSDADELGRLDVAFHSAIADASGNVILLDLQRSLMTQFLQELGSIHHFYRSPERDHAEHTALLDAIQRHDPGLAADRMRAHLAGVRRAIEQWDG